MKEQFLLIAKTINRLFWMSTLEHLNLMGNIPLTALRLRGGAQAGCTASVRCRIITGSCPSLLPYCTGRPGPPAWPRTICLGICQVKLKADFDKRIYIWKQDTICLHTVITPSHPLTHGVSETGSTCNVHACNILQEVCTVRKSNRQTGQSLGSYQINSFLSEVKISITGV